MKAPGPGALGELEGVKQAALEKAISGATHLLLYKEDATLKHGADARAGILILKPLKARAITATTLS